MRTIDGKLILKALVFLHQPLGKAKKSAPLPSATAETLSYENAVTRGFKDNPINKTQQFTNEH
jgi:hypothetical protein